MQIRKVAAFILVVALAVPAFPVLGAQSQAGPGTEGWERWVKPLLERPGLEGVTYFPAVFGGTLVVEILDPTGYTIHVAEAGEAGPERAYPAGEPFRQKAGRWRFWLQGEWSMTPFSKHVNLPHSGVLIDCLPVAPAGRVTVEGVPSQKREGGELWLLYADSSPYQHELSRLRPLDEAREEGILMPAGTVITAVWDPEEEGYTALSRPFTVPATSFVPAPLERPEMDASQLVAFVAWPGSAERASHADLALRVNQGEDSLEPDFTHATTWGVYAVWYDLRPGPAVLEGGDEVVYLPEETLELAGGEIARFEGRLVRRPVLDVSLVLPSLLREKPFSLEVHRLPEGEMLAEVELPRRSGGHRFHAEMVHGLVEVRLVTHAGPYPERVDLTDREEVSLTLEPELIELWGTVRHGGEPHPARLGFDTVSRVKVETTADEDGEYRVHTLEPVLWLKVELEADGEEDGPPPAPWLDSFMPPIRESRQLDVDVPDAEVIARVRDAATGEGIAGADVAVRSVYLLDADEVEGVEEAAPGAPPDRRRERVLGTSYETGEEGVARLAPPRRGRIEVTASAPGYRPQPQPLVEEIADPDQDRQLELALEPWGEMARLRLALPDGSPAAGAQVWRVTSTADGELLFTGQADAAGVVEVPEEPVGGQLLLRHPAAAVGIADWSRLRDAGEWTFRPAAELPLTLRAVDPSGETPVVRASLALWIDGRKLSGGPLRLLLDVPDRTGAGGAWVATHLPRAAVAVLVWSRASNDQARAGALDTLATPVPYPFPARVEVRGVR